jgi:tRNA (guanine37-N1)-methyltransferase
LKKGLLGVIPRDSVNSVPRSYDLIGSKDKAVILIEIPVELRQYENEIADWLMDRHKNVVTVLNKESKRDGSYRTRSYRIIAGDKKTEVIHRESGCVFKLDPRLVYFSPRESAERERISGSVKEPEKILVMFSGVGPIPICITKKNVKVTATAIEMNPYAHNYCVENIYLNKVGDRVNPLLGDVRKVCTSIGEKFNRVIMPLPKGAYKYLDVAVPMLLENGLLQFYHWAPEKNLFDEAEELVSDAFRRFGKRASITKKIKVSQYSPRVWKIRVDARLIK